VRRIDTFLDAAADTLGADGHALGINQVLVNEYKPGQGISVSVEGESDVRLRLSSMSRLRWIASQI